MEHSSLDEHNRSGLPPWTYFSEELLDLERRELFRRCWQIACHANDVPDAGDYTTFDIVGERALIVRDHDGVVRAFHNVCRHRGSRVVADQKGHCRGALVCPFHGWSFNLDGTLRAVSQKRTLPELDPVRYGLVPLEYEIWNGFVFVRFQPGDQPSVAEILAPHAEELGFYRVAEAKPLKPVQYHQIPANWKAVRDVDNESYHVPIAHPSYHDLCGGGCYDTPAGFGMGRAFARFNDSPSKFWSVARYKKLLPEVENLPASHQRAWLYIGIFPNMVLMLYPDRIGFYQEYPLALGKTEQRHAYYGHDDFRPEMKAARYLSFRMDAITGAEDDKLIEWSWESMQSSGFRGVVLSDLESSVRNYHDQLRRVLPVMSLNSEPARGHIEHLNASMRTSMNLNPWETR